MKAVVLAGGEGTRLRPLTFTRPKPMLPLGPNPAIHYVLTHLAEQGFRDVIVVAGYLKDQIMGYVGDGSRFGLRTTYVVEPGGIFFGTAGCLKLAEHLLDQDSEPFLVAQADTLTEIPLGRMAESHRKSPGVDVTIALTEVSDPSEYGVAVLDETHRIKGFQEKPQPGAAMSNLVSTGFYLLNPEVLDYLKDEKWDFAKDLFPHLMRSGRSLSGFASRAFWVDIGGLQGYLEGTKWVIERLASSDRGGRSDGAADERSTHVPQSASASTTIGRDVEIGRGVRIAGPVLIEDEVIVGDGVTLSPYTVVKRGASVLPDTSINRSVLLENVIVGKGSSIESSVIGETAALGQGVEIAHAIIGQGSVVGDRAVVSSGSRIWPNLTIGIAERVEGKIVAVPREKAFYFYTWLGDYTGVLASSVSEFLEALERVPLSSIEFHLARRDFERWAKEILGSIELADSVRGVRKSLLDDEERRSELIRFVRAWMERTTELQGAVESQ